MHSSPRRCCRNGDTVDSIVSVTEEAGCLGAPDAAAIARMLWSRLGRYSLGQLHPAAVDGCSSGLPSAAPGGRTATEGGAAGSSAGRSTAASGGAGLGMAGRAHLVAGLQGTDEGADGPGGEDVQRGSASRRSGPT